MDGAINFAVSTYEPSGYGKRHVGKVMNGTGETLPVMAMRRKQELYKGNTKWEPDGRESEGIIVPRNIRTTQPGGGKGPCCGLMRGR